MDAKDGPGAVEAARAPVQSAEFRAVEVLLTVFLAQMGRKQRARAIAMATEMFESWGAPNQVVPISWRRADEAAGRSALAWWRSRLPGMLRK